MGIFDDLLKNMFGGTKGDALSAPVITCSNNVVTMTGNGTIYYTTDGTTPTTSSSVYGSSIGINQNTTFKAICVSPGLTPSDVTTYTAEYFKPMSETYFFVEDISGLSNTLRISSRLVNLSGIHISKSTDETTWTSLGTTPSSGTLTATVPANGRLYLKATTNQWCNGETNYNSIICDGDYNVGGNIMSLLFGDNFIGQTSLPNYTYTFGKLFENATTLQSAENLVLPAITLTQHCYDSMFWHCTSLTTAPSVLPATTLADWCYAIMFEDCSSLTTAPELPATTLAYACYNRMFQRCSSLTTSPLLPALIVGAQCYEWMFTDCISLNSITCLATDISRSLCTNYWVDGVSSSGTFTKAASMTGWTTGNNGIPSGWTVQNAS